jgi:uncharacterized protein YabN with tetrapyrrole methylase and pyrophosphatase domain
MSRLEGNIDPRQDRGGERRTTRGAADKVADELVNLIFDLANIARHAAGESEQAPRETNTSFRSDFVYEDSILEENRQSLSSRWSA